ncbi:shikimate dehydrogenase [Nitrosospira multiformis]|uniref:Shikimate dehydrogenase (NADP(+)) n=1 Tax=Nitrosospira multiformis TaxID=1231 RepID=A0A1I7FAN8_9PROT|nr:shikimate dehydrogenase [Nitrosospira multiformis]SFU33211.1 shikimate dehydrogenase [Nitrosospira multiformis]
MSDLYAVIGNPVAHSKSPLIHARFARQTGQDIHYEAILAPLDGFVETVVAFRQRGGKGANVTVPFKLEACALSSRLTERAKAAGAVNTLVFEADDILGDNTDGAGLVRDIVVNLGYALGGQRVLLMGAGGAARGVIRPVLEHEPAVLTIANRTRQKADDLQQLFASSGNVVSTAYGDLRGQEFDLVINATSASLHGDLPPQPKGIFAAASLAYDMMYGKGHTPFLQFAQQQGAARLADGIGMLVEQAAESFFLWRGTRPETEPVIEMLRSSLGSP